MALIAFIVAADYFKEFTTSVVEFWQKPNHAYLLGRDNLHVIFSDTQRNESAENQCKSLLKQYAHDAMPYHHFQR